MDNILEEEYTERLFTNHNSDSNIIKKLKKVKSPSVIVLLSNKLNMK